MAERANVNAEKTAQSYTNQESNVHNYSSGDETVWRDDQEVNKANQSANTQASLSDFPKKKSAFQITSVKPANQTENDVDSMDDLDESHTGDISGLDWSKTTDADHDPSSDDTISLANADDVATKPVEDVNQNKEKESSTRFRVVKIESREPFLRGRWKCFDFLDPPIGPPISDQTKTKTSEHKKEAGSGNSSAASSIHYVPGEDDPAKNPLDGTVVIQGDNQQVIVASPTRSMVCVPGIQDSNIQENKSKSQRVAQYSVSNDSVAVQSNLVSSTEFQANKAMTNNINQSVSQPANNKAVSNGQSQSSTNISSSPSPKQGQSVSQTVVHSSTQNHFQPQAQQTVPEPSGVQTHQQQTLLQSERTQLVVASSNGDLEPIAPSEPSTGVKLQVPQQSALASQPAASVKASQSVQSTSSHPSSAQPVQAHVPVPVGNRGETNNAVGATSQVSVTNSSTGPVAPSSSKPLADLKATNKESRQLPSLSSANAQVEMLSNRDSADMSSVESVLRETLQGTMSTISPQPGSPTGKRDSTEGAEGAGPSTVGIDNKIEAAMDLVKSHLMAAVREEVEVLKEQIKGLIETNKQLQIENQALRQTAPPEVLATVTHVNSDQLPSSSSTSS